jgi:hypothetical protein
MFLKHTVLTTHQPQHALRHPLNLCKSLLGRALTQSGGQQCLCGARHDGVSIPSKQGTDGLETPGHIAFTEGGVFQSLLSRVLMNSGLPASWKLPEDGEFQSLLSRVLMKWRAWRVLRSGRARSFNPF